MWKCARRHSEGSESCSLSTQQQLRKLRLLTRILTGGLIPQLKAAVEAGEHVYCEATGGVNRHC